MVEFTEAHYEQYRRQASKIQELERYILLMQKTIKGCCDQLHNAEEELRNEQKRLRRAHHLIAILLKRKSAKSAKTSYHLMAKVLNDMEC